MSEVSDNRQEADSRPALSGDFQGVALSRESISWSPCVGIEFVRQLSADSLRSTGSTSACWSSVCGLTSTTSALAIGPVRAFGQLSIGAVRRTRGHPPGVFGLAHPRTMSGARHRSG
jgi:hypothetical protein